jgi:hypothetical protein
MLGSAAEAYASYKRGEIDRYALRDWGFNPDEIGDPS